MTRLFGSCLALSAVGLLGLGAMTPAFAGGGCAACSSSKSTASVASADIVGVASSAGTFETLLAAAGAAGLVETLQSEGPLTVLAPTDDAFAKLPEGTVDSLLLPENKDRLAEILTYHVIAGKVKAEQALEAGEAATVQGDTVLFALEDGQAQVNGINILATDVKASNGVIHVIDEVLIPAEG
ncbi:MAG: fasciclin domain-containing protein [Planctomycetota bacterium]